MEIFIAYLSFWGLLANVAVGLRFWRTADRLFNRATRRTSR